MTTPATWRTLGLAALLAAGAAAALADTLVLRSGRRVEGRLVGVRGDTVEFEERRGWSGARRLARYDRADVQRIELDEEEGLSDRDRYDEDEPSGRPRGLREREVNVTAMDAWTDTGVDVRSGQSVYFSASGRVSWGPGRRDDPGGEMGSPRNPNRPIPGRPAAALIGRVGEGNDVFFIGKDEGPIRMRSSGRLYLGVNDDHLPDNTGAFRVTVYY